MKWTKEACNDDALIYKHRSQWKNNSPSAYARACKRGWLYECTSHMVPVSHKTKYTPESILESTKGYSSRSRWAREQSGAYKAAIRLGILDQIVDKMPVLLVHNKWTKEAVLADARKYSATAEWYSASNSACQIARKKGWYGEAIAHMRLSKRKHGHWHKDSVLDDALKYPSRVAWSKASSGAYDAAVANNWLHECTVHMSRPAPYQLKWIKDACIADAKKYRSRTEWSKQSGSAYNSALLNGWLTECCADMHKKISTGEDSLLALTRSIFPKAQKARFGKVIKGQAGNSFELDVYIPELRKGIEFNGDYWHSLSGLKRGRLNWSDEQLANYHQIKREFFSSRGIDYLEIWEKEWNKDRASCIAKISQFLNIPNL